MLIAPLPIKLLLQDVDRLKAEIDDACARLQFAVAETRDEIFGAMSDRREAVKPYLRGRALDGVHRPEQLVDVFRIRIRLQRQQRLGDRLQVLFHFRNKKLEHLRRNIVVGGQV